MCQIIYIMDVIKCFYKNGYLFKCSPCNFDNMMFNHMKDMIDIYKNGAVSDFDHKNENLLHCMICFRWVGRSREFTICENCCNTCIGKKVLFNMCMRSIYPTFWYYDDISKEHKMIPRDSYNNYFPEHHYKNQVLNNFINNVSKLKHRFYHDSEIIFLLSIYDHASSLHTLNWDIMIYILRFIY